MLVISGATKVCGIIGGPQQVPRSLSPAIHNAAFEHLEMDWAYLAFPVVSVQEALVGMRALGIVGTNVTMPHKVSALSSVDDADATAKKIGAVNTIVQREGRLFGSNTDASGFLRFLTQDVGFAPQDKVAVVIGTGGAARAVVVALSLSQAKSIVVAGRDGAQAGVVAGLAPQASGMSLDDISAEHVSKLDLIVNATPLGQAGELPPVPIEGIGPAHTVVDLVYWPPQTPLVKAARARGAAAHGGLGMLVQQAGLSFEVWTGTRAPLEVMSSAAVAALAARMTRA